MGGRAERIRLFVAAYPPLTFIEGALERVRDVAPPGSRVMMPNQVHLTVQFIGDVRVNEVEEVSESVRRSTLGIEGFVLTPRRLMTLPDRGAARLIALETDTPAPLLELHRRLSHRLSRATRSDAADRFQAHLTLCRFKVPLEGLTLSECFEAPAFTVDRIVLVRSVLRPQGAEHAPIAEFPLGGAAGQDR